jgi:LysR family glycine cleavage system transcriptional activator
MPPLRALRAFQVAGRHLSFKDAADELHLTASAVSHQVKNLESFLELELFERKTRALELTEAGRSYHEFLDGIFARLQAETHQLCAEYGRAIVRLCVPPFFASELLLPKLPEFQALMPDTDIRLTTQPSLMKIHPADADASVLLGTGDWPGLETVSLFSRRLVTACSSAYKKAARIRTHSDLDGETLIVHENRPHSWSNWAKAVGAPPPRAGKIVRFDSMADVVQAAAQGAGIAIVSWPMSRKWFESGKLVRVLEDEVDTEEDFYLAYRLEAAERTEVLSLINWIIEQYRKDE